ncbi:RagB/SusD family nutrient uptake outer membrane protein [Myroides odoratimimus]|uniref:RagB/SusD family nutrient uptake outer membrane protein n=1 Tax=Myroides odoratimimus TaxID=76832 RepID=UPI00257858DD|nr:RagB/SusD family nutrient uptake outer membrane protein [Myroides odoratimimus]MDM1448889.1 RagB/SusD family nutrient uptake outer membrane protein [Myroides odoratimimus]MDM1465875.1 RagB/SusD family nutrient uptake outer membrane protein [Myroides odoratimimus]MDM1469006.1 RagB/SusD family nutrient uptake outer membrane protein [Myroides odoratimimus]MDM1479018.1 RagB/SusD family nutrient uptake outer membrane protein [Myroides odoratimimus]
MKKKFSIFLIVGMITLTGGVLNSCSIEPSQSNYKDNTKDPIKNKYDMLASLNGSYARMTSASYYGRDIIAFSECRSSYMYSDDRTGRFGVVSAFSLNPTFAYPRDTWKQIYMVISNTNRILEAQVEDSPEVKNYRGQAYVIRALAHYDLLRLYGEQYVDGKGLNALGVPYKTSFKDIDEILSRPNVGENMNAIFADLNQGIDLLKDAKLGNGDKHRINLASAYGIKSRIALFFGKYDKSKYDIVIESSLLAINSSNVKVMSRSSFLDAYKGDGIMSNSLFELTQSGTDNKGNNSLYNIYVKKPDTGEGYGDLVWIEATKENIFPTKKNNVRIDDIRSAVVDTLKKNDVYRNIGKYTSRISNIRMLRIEEIMLNYVEAALYGASNADMAKALDFFNQIVEERVLEGGIPKVYSTLSISEYKDERVKELMFEGFAYEDIMRWETKVNNPKLSENPDIPVKTIQFGDKLTVFPIPQSEINVSKVEQNQAYK